jgi:hypothetical protein
MIYQLLPCIKTLEKHFKVCNQSASGLIWLLPTSNRVQANTKAGTKDVSNGYWKIKFLSKQYYCHRIVYYLHSKIDPKDFEIDHVDQNKSNNNPLNLRLATRSQNSANRNKNRTNTSGYKGVCWVDAKQKWTAQITYNNKHFNLGYFNTIEEAYAQYNKEAAKLFKEYVPRY